MDTRANNVKKALPVLMVGALLALYPVVSGSFGIDLATKIMVYAIYALSLELLVGSTGLVCFGHAAFFGLGGYATVLLAPQSDAASLWWLLPAAMGTAALYALFMGALSLRTKGVYFIMVTLAFAQMAYYVVHDTPLGGGTDGIYLNSGKPVAALGSWVLIDLDRPLTLYYFVLGSLAATFFFLAVLLRSTFGRALAGIKANEQRMRATGFSTYPYKLAAFVVSGALAGLAGFLFAVKDAYVNPELLSWHQSGSVLIMIILGGLGHLRGAVLGAFAFALLQELFRSEAIFGAFAKHWHLGLGLTIIVCVAVLPRGLIGLSKLFKRRLAGTPKEAAHAKPEVFLRGRDITQRWGGLVALDSVSIELERGAIHAVIGTNGAGKSTLINILSGEFKPTQGRVELLGEDVTAWQQPRRARAGLGRSYQRNTIYPGFSVFENCRLAAQATRQRPWRWWSDATHDPVTHEHALQAATRAGLDGLLEREAGLLSHGQKRQLEVAMCLATRPQVLLLDEPLAGMGAEETDRMLALLAQLRTDHAILLVEHDMDAVFRVADRITVMVNGAVLASDAPASVRNNPEVRAAYLGEHA